ncbi:MAG: DUF1848 domain-containing protein [Candidatus Bathyarchaeota archaeon]|nr:DUF1848 domain-containing protein [Candidatus Bathyarchaeota archaeon]
MIISASRRTDIPAFYSKWFMERIKAGFYVKVNPFNAKQKMVVSLSPEDVDCIVFWTKNPKPLMPHLSMLDKLGYNYYFQFTVNDYPKELEPALPSIKSRVKIFQELSKKIGKQKVIWRYDPIIVSNRTTVDDHILRFQTLADQLSPYTHHVVISFVDMYGKTKNKFRKIEENHGLEFLDLKELEHKEKLLFLTTKLARIAEKRNLEITTCAEKINLDQVGIGHGACIDKDLIGKLFHQELYQKKDKNQRNECLCVESEEMGMYDTCKFNCTYCYAVRSEKIVSKNVEKHNYKSPQLIGEVKEEELELYFQLKLFD